MIRLLSLLVGMLLSSCSTIATGIMAAVCAYSSLYGCQAQTPQLLTVLFFCFAAVNLTSSGTCPGDTVVFTCITDTGRLVWSVNNNNELFYLPGQVSEIGRTRDIFTLRLISVTGSVFVSTATAHNVSYGSNGINITCIDSDIISAGTNTRIGTIKIS